MTILVTGGAGFIGSNFVLDWLAQGGETVVNLDALTYAGNLRNLAALQGDARHVFVHGDIGNRALLAAQAGDDVLHVLALFAAADEHRIGRFHHYHVVQPDGADQSARRVHQRVVAVAHDGVTDRGIAMGVFVTDLPDGVPGTEI